MQAEPETPYVPKKLSELPAEILLNCFDYLISPSDLVALSKTNKQLRAVAFDKELWRKFCYLKFRSSPKAIVLYKHKTGIYRVKYQTDALVSVGFDMQLQCYDIKSLKNIKTIKLGSVYKMRIIYMAFFSDNHLVESHFPMKIIRIWDYQQGICVHKLIVDYDVVSALATFTDKLLLSAHCEKPMRLWDKRSGKLIKTINTQNYIIGRAKFISKNKCITLCSSLRNPHKKPNERTRWLILWDIQQESIIKKIRYDSWGWVLSLFPEEGWIIVAERHGKISVYDTQLINKIRRVDVSLGYITCIEPLSDGVIAIGSESGEIKLWDFKQNRQINSFMNDANKAVNSISKLSDTTFFSAGRDKKIRLWEFKSTPENLLQQDCQTVSTNQANKHCAIC